MLICRELTDFKGYCSLGIKGGSTFPSSVGQKISTATAISDNVNKLAFLAEDANKEEQSRERNKVRIN